MTKKKTIAQELNVKEFPFIIKDNQDRLLYKENSDGYWFRNEWTNSRITYYETSNGYWNKWEYDSNNLEIYYVDSRGFIRDNRVKEYTMDEIAKALNIDVNKLKIKK